MFGSHLSIAGGMHNALLEAHRLNMGCVQVFTKNQRQFSSAPLSEEGVRLWREHVASTGIRTTVSHDSYLINLAAPGEENWKRSIAMFQDEVERCEALGIPWLVTHPGAAMGQSEQEGLSRIAAGLDEVHARTVGFKTVTCLEITAGQGSSLGWRFEHLRDVIARVREPARLAVCLDTAHLLAAGYDLTSGRGARAVIAECEAVLGVGRVRVLHVNDSKTPRGSRVDRHEHIGKGHVSLEAFAALVRHEAFEEVPKILETPKEEGPGGRPWDTINMEVLVGLTGRKSRGNPGGGKVVNKLQRHVKSGDKVRKKRGKTGPGS